MEASFACSYGVLSALVFDFHEVAFGLPILLYALWAYLERRDGHLIAACSLMCLVKEDMPMYAAGIALALFFTGRRLFGLLLGAASVAVTLVLIFVVVPYFSYWGHYTYIGGNARGLRSFGAALATFGQHLFSGPGITFLLLIAVTAGLGLCRPIMLVVLPTVLFRFMANDTVYLGFRFQYGVLLTGVAFMALIDGWAWLLDRPAAGGLDKGRSSDKSQKKSRWASRVRHYLQLAQVAVLLLGAVGGLWGSGALNRVDDLSGMDAVLADKTAVQAQIPDGANVAADVFLVPQIVDRTTVQVAFPTWQDETGKPIRADYVFLDLGTISYQEAGPNWVSNLITRLTAPGGGYEKITQHGRFVLLKRLGL